MAHLADIVHYLDRELKIAETPDYSAAHNGLQLESGGAVTKVASAVDASLPVIEKAIQQKADLLVVHHGMFWQGVRMLTGANYRKLKLAMDSGLAIYSSHIPLDVHPLMGNNVLLADAISLKERGAFMEWKGVHLGICGTTGETLGDLRERVGRAVSGPVHFCGELSKPAGKIGIITGGAGSQVEAIAAEGIDTLVTGEGPHWSYPLAEELQINILYAGHYATETFGVRRLAEEIAKIFHLEATFIDHPTGL